MSSHYSRRQFLAAGAAGSLAVPLGGGLSAAASRREYRGPNVILVRFGGGVRRLETIDEEQTHCPFLLKEFAPRGTLFRKVDISLLEGQETSHGQGTLHILTGRYDHYEDVGGKFLGARFEAKVPTLFEYLRKSFAVPEHQTLIVNGEDRTDEEFYSFSNHHLFGAEFRSNVLSLFRFKLHLLRNELREGKLTDAERREKQKAVRQMEALDYRTQGRAEQSIEITRFWEQWEKFYGRTGFKNPRGDRLLTELTIRAMERLRPRLVMVNYNDCDYVHWGYRSHYTRGIAIMDHGLRQLVEAVERDEFYRGNTVFVILPDCGRDTNRFLAVPCQHHFGTRSAHEIFAVLVGPGIERGRVVDQPVEQNMIAATIGKLMGFPTPHTEGRPLEEALA